MLTELQLTSLHIQTQSYLSLSGTKSFNRTFLGLGSPGKFQTSLESQEEKQSVKAELC